MRSAGRTAAESWSDLRAVSLLNLNAHAVDFDFMQTTNASSLARPHMHHADGHTAIGVLLLLTRSSTATLRAFHTNSATAMTQATPMPPSSTTNTPPTFASPSSLAAELLLLGSSCRGYRRTISEINSMVEIVPPEHKVPTDFQSMQAENLLTLQEPPPRFSFHHLVLSMCSFPSSCSFSTAPLMAVR